MSSTPLSDGRLHSKFDRHACNDADLKRELLQKVGLASPSMPSLHYYAIRNDAHVCSGVGVVPELLHRPCSACQWHSSPVRSASDVISAAAFPAWLWACAHSRRSVANQPDRTVEPAQYGVMHSRLSAILTRVTSSLPCGRRINEHSACRPRRTVARAN